MGLTIKENDGVCKSIVEAVGVEAVGLASCSTRVKKRGMAMRNSLPPTTRKLRSHSASSNHVGINGNVATSTKVTGESSGCYSTEPRQTGRNELPPPTLEFHVRSEEGINLFVDLNSNSSDWTKKLKSEVCIHPEMLNANTRVLHRHLRIIRENEEERIKTSFLGTTAVNMETTGDPKVVECLPSSVTAVNMETTEDPKVIECLPSSVTAVNLETTEDTKVIECLPSSVTAVNLETTGDTKVIECLPSSVVRDIPEANTRSSETTTKNISESSLIMENDQKVSSLCDKDSQNTIDLSSESHLQNCNETFVSASSKLSDISGNGSKSDGKCPATAETVPASVSSKLVLPVVSKFCEDQVSPITSVLEIPGGVLHVCSTVDSMMQSSEVASYSNGTEKCSVHSRDRSDLDGPMTYLETDKGVSGNKEPVQNTNGDPLYASSEVEVGFGGSNPINEKDGSECSQINKSSKRSFLSLGTPEPGRYQIERRITRSQDRQSKARRSSRRLALQYT